MKVIRVNETVNVSARAFQESAHAIIDTQHRAHPFVIPVSHLLRVERYRGLECKQTANVQPSVRHLHGSVRRLGPHIEINHQNPDNRHRTVASDAHRNRPPSRSFSSHIAKQQPQPPRRPPIPPRRTLTPSRIQSALAAQEDDVLSSIPATTGAELDRRTTIEREQLRKKQIKEDITETPWFNTASALDSQLKLSADTIAVLDLERTEIRKRARKEVDRDYRKYVLPKVEEFERKLAEHEAHVAALRGEYRSNLSKAKKQGARDFKVYKRLKTRGGRDVLWEVNNLAANVYELRKGLADYMYTFDWMFWKRERTHRQALEAIHASHQLKKDNGWQSASRRKTDDLEVAYRKLASLLDELDRSLLMSRKQATSRSQAQRHAKIFAIGLDIENFSNNISPMSHEWRRQEHHAVLELRFPQYTAHVCVDVEARHIISAMRYDSRLLANALIKAVRTPVASSAHRQGIYAEMRLISSNFNDRFVKFTDEFLELLQNGLLMLNPAMRSNFGRLKYALMRPFTAYSAAMLETQKGLRDGRETILALRGWTDSQATSAQSDPVLKWSANLYQTYDNAHVWSKNHVRQVLGDSNEAMYKASDRLLAVGDSRLEEILHQEARNTRIQMLQDRALKRLSSLSVYSDQVYAERVADPIGVMGRKELYPEAEGYSVELVSSNRGLHRVMQELLLEKVIGIDVFHRADISQKGAFISIATTQKVVVIDWNTWTPSGLRALGLVQTLFTQLLESPSILKVFYSIDAVRSYFTDRNIFPKAVVSLSESQMKSKTNLPSRVVSTGVWKPPRLSAHASDELVIPFIADIAFLSVYNLWIFLHKAPVTSENSMVEPGMRTNILRARENLLHKIASAGQNASIELGPLKVDSESLNFNRMLARFQTDVHTESVFVNVARLAARITLSTEVNKIDRKKKERDLAAYYMLTAMKQEWSIITEMLGGRIKASEVLRLVETMNLTLHTKDRESLELAAKVVQEEMETDDASIDSENTSPYLSHSPSEDDETQPPRVRITSASSPLRLRRIESKLRKQEAANQTGSSAKRLYERQIVTTSAEGFAIEPSQGSGSSDSQTGSSPERTITYGQSDESTAFSPIAFFKGSPQLGDSKAEVETTKMEIIKPRSERPSKKSKGLSERQISVRKPARTISRPLKTKKSLVSARKIKEKSLLRYGVGPPNVVSDEVKNVLAAAKHEWAGETASLVTNAIQASTEKLDARKDSNKKDVQQESASNPQQQNHATSAHVENVLEGAQSTMTSKASFIAENIKADSEGQGKPKSMYERMMNSIRNKARVGSIFRPVQLNQNDSAPAIAEDEEKWSIKSKTTGQHDGAKAENKNEDISQESRSVSTKTENASKARRRKSRGERKESLQVSSVPAEKGERPKYVSSIRRVVLDKSVEGPRP